MVENIVFILGFFVLFYFLLLLYDFISLYYHKKEIKIDDKRKKRLVELITEKESRIKENSKVNSKLFKKLKKLPYLSAFADLLEENIIIQEKPICKIVQKETYRNLFVILCEYYQKKDNLSIAYYAYVLHYIPIKENKIYEFLYHCLSLKSIYCIENALFALNYFNDAVAVSNAYLFMTRKKVDYGHKLVADSLLSFQGKKIELCQNLYKNFDQYHDSLQVGILTFFRQTGYDIKEELYKRIEQNQLKKEVIIETIRYFSKIEHKEIVPLLLERLESNFYNDFEYNVVIIQTLAFYPSKKVIQVLKNALSDANYYVRYNAAKSLNKMTDLKQIKDLKDPFAKEMLTSLIEEV